MEKREVIIGKEKEEGKGTVIVAIEEGGKMKGYSNNDNRERRLRKRV